MTIKILIFTILGFFILGCSEAVPKPKIQQKKQFVSKNITTNHYKIEEFRRMMHKENIKPIYIYIDSSLKSEIDSADIPNIKRMTYSLLSDFGDSVKVITSLSQKDKLISNPTLSKRVFLLDGAITAFDQGIFSQSSSASLNIKIGSIGDKKSSKNKFKNKKKTSQMIADLYLKQNGIIRYKTTSSIMIRETSKGYSFGLSLYGFNLGVSSYKNIKDGLGLSVRKIIEGSLIDLVSKAISIQSFQVMPEIQMKKMADKPTHLSNYDFCSDINRIVFYVKSIKDIKFSAFGMSYESEQNKLKCLKDLYRKSISKGENINIILKTIIGNNMNLSQAQQNARIVRREILKQNIPRNILIIKNKFIKEQCTKDKEYCNFIKNRIEISKVIQR